MRHRQTYRAITSVILLALFSIPWGVPALHELFHYHEHFHCQAEDTLHWHEKADSCELCDYLITVKPPSAEWVEFSSTPSIEATGFAMLAPGFSNENRCTYLLRGPPSSTDV